MADLEASFRLLFATKFMGRGAPREWAESISARLVGALAEKPDYPGCADNLHRAIEKPFGQMLGRCIMDELLGGKISIETAVAEDAQAILDFELSERETIVAHVYKCLKANGVGESAAKDAKTAEWSIYNRTINNSTAIVRSWENPEFVSMYSSRASAVLANLNPQSSICREYGNALFEMIKAGKVTYADLGNMEAIDMCPKAYEKERKEIEIRSQQVIEEKTSALYPCPRCKKAKSIYREVQDRAADEPASIYCKCLECGHTYRGA